MQSRILFTLLIGLLLGSPAAAQNSKSEGLSDREIKLLYGEFKTVRSFGLISVSLVGEAARLGLASGPLRDYVRERFKKDFCKVEYRDVTEDPRRFAELLATQNPKFGTITFRIWVVGEAAVLAYHVRCDAGSFRNFSIWSEEVLGHGTKATLTPAIEDILAEMMTQLADSFFRARGEKCG